MIAAVEIAGVAIRRFVEGRRAQTGSLPTLADLVAEFGGVRPMSSQIEGLEVADHFFWRGAWRPWRRS